LTELLKFNQVVAGYGQARILHGVDLAVESNERVAILGRNGVGKTTVVNTFLSSARLMQGSVELAGQRINQLRYFTAARHGISVVPQGRRIIPGLTVRENLLLGAAVDRQGPWNLQRVFELFPILAERADTPGTALSGGQQQMLAIGRALMANPALLVLDEPSEGLAPVIVDELVQVLCDLAGEGIALLLIEQNLSLVQRVTKRYYVMAKGTIVESGDLAGLTTEGLKQHLVV